MIVFSSCFGNAPPGRPQQGHPHPLQRRSKILSTVRRRAPGCDRAAGPDAQKERSAEPVHFPSGRQPGSHAREKTEHQGQAIKLLAMPVAGMTGAFASDPQAASLQRVSRRSRQARNDLSIFFFGLRLYGDEGDLVA